MRSKPGFTSVCGNCLRYAMAWSTMRSRPAGAARFCSKRSTLLFEFLGLALLFLNDFIGGTLEESQGYRACAERASSPARASASS
jgi:hypothetical protein